MRRSKKRRRDGFQYEAEEKEVSSLVGKAIMVHEEKGEKIKKEEERWVLI